jgi:hypothetical protein
LEQIRRKKSSPGECEFAHFPVKISIRSVLIENASCHLERCGIAGVVLYTISGNAQATSILSATMSDGKHASVLSGANGSSKTLASFSLTESMMEGGGFPKTSCFGDEGGNNPKDPHTTHHTEEGGWIPKT